MATRDTYTKVHEKWNNRPDKTTPVFAEDVEHIEQGIKDAADKRALKEIYDDNSINLGRKSGTTAGQFSTAEGNQTKASAYCSHAEGYNTVASNSKSHAEGESTQSSGDASHSEGYETKALSGGSHAEGNNTTASGYASHSEGGSTTASGQYAHAEGYSTEASASESHAEGYDTVASGDASHAEGNYTKVYDRYGHSEGYSTVSGFEQQPSASQANHAEGYGTKSAGNYCHAEGYGAIAGENPGTSGSHAEGNQTKAVGNYSHAEGVRTTASGEGSHAEGIDTTQLNQTARATHTEGIGTQAVEDAQHVGGKYNNPSSNCAVIIGSGTSDSERKNIYMLDWQGNAVFAGNVQITYNGRNISLYGIQMEMESRFNSLVNGIMPAKVFDTKSDLDTWLTEEGNADTLKIGQNIYIKETGTPDYWWDGTGLRVLETDKVEIEAMTYDETMAILNATAEEVE